MINWTGVFYHALVSGPAHRHAHRKMERRHQRHVAEVTRIMAERVNRVSGVPTPASRTVDHAAESQRWAEIGIGIAAVVLAGMLLIAVALVSL